jgi:hypothetical protein
VVCGYFERKGTDTRRIRRIRGRVITVCATHIPVLRARRARFWRVGRGLS